MDGYSLKIAGIIRRALACIVDYLVFWLLYLSIESIVRSVALDPAIFFFSAATYFTLTNGILTKKTLGKRLFGIRTVRLDGGTIPIGMGFCRFFFSYGLLIFACEIVDITYRETAFTASAEMLEFHMALIMAYGFANVVLSTVGPRGRGIHDLICGTEVVLEESIVAKSKIVPQTDNVATPVEGQKSGGAPVDNKKTKPSTVKRIVLALAGSVIGILLWHSGLPQDSMIRTVVSRRYQLEKALSVRVGNMAIVKEELIVSLYPLPNAPAITEEKLSPFFSDLRNTETSSSAAVTLPNPNSAVGIGQAVSGQMNLQSRSVVKTLVFQICELNDPDLGKKGKETIDPRGEASSGERMESDIECSKKIKLSVQ